MRMSKFLDAFNNRKGGASQKQIKQGEKKQLNNVLKTAFLQAQDDQTAVFRHNEQVYILETADRRNSFIRNGGNGPTNQLEQGIADHWKEIHFFMQNINPETQMELFADVDEFSFPFAEIQSQFGSKSKAVKLKMQNLLKKWQVYYLDRHF